MKKAKFEIEPYPKQEDIEIWDEEGKNIDPELAKNIPIVKLKT